MNTYIEYTIITKADIQGVDATGSFSTQDSYQQQSSFNNAGSDRTAVLKRLDLLVLPTSSSGPIASRVIDINLETMDVDYISILHVKSEAQFLFSASDSLNNLNATPKELAKVLFKDYGRRPNQIYTNDLGYPKYIRLINPIEINGGGSGNDNTDIPIYIQLHLVTHKL